MDFKKYLPNKKAFTALLVGSIMAIMIGAILLVVSYVVINAIMATVFPVSTSSGYICWMNATNPLCSGALNSSYMSSLNNIAQALNIAGIALIVAGIAGIIYMLIGLGGTAGGRGR